MDDPAIDPAIRRSAIRVLLADDHAVLREGLKRLLEHEPDIEIVGEAATGVETIRLVQTAAPDVVLMDIAMPELNGLEATRRILALHPDAKIVILSMHLDGRYVKEALAAGAVGYVLKSSAYSEVVEAIREAAKGQAFFSPPVAGVVAQYFRRPAAASPGAGETLSDREHEIFRLLAEGRSARDIAEMLHLSVKTVETHRRHIMEKLHVDSLAELVKEALREGLIRLED